MEKIIQEKDLKLFELKNRKKVMIAREGNSIITHANLLLIIGPQFLDVCLPNGAVTKNIKI
jgi:hypothetical protein